MKEESELLLSARMALIGEVPPNLRGVAIESNRDNIIIYFYNNGTMTDEEKNDYRCIGTEIIADFNSGMIDERIIQLDYPIQIPSHRYWAYRRKEKLSSSFEMLSFSEHYIKKTINRDAYLLLSTQQALLGTITHNLRGVAVDEINDKVNIYFYYDSDQIDKKNINHDNILSQITRELGHIIINEKIIPLNYPSNFPDHRLWVYRRKESYTKCD